MAWMASLSNSLNPFGIGLSLASLMLAICLFLSKNVGSFVLPFLNGLNADVRLPVIALRHVLILSSMTEMLYFCSRKCSINWIVEVMSQISELTHPPLDHGEAMINEI